MFRTTEALTSQESSGVSRPLEEARQGVVFSAAGFRAFGLGFRV